MLLKLELLFFQIPRLPLGTHPRYHRCVRKLFLSAPVAIVLVFTGCSKPTLEVSAPGTTLGRATPITVRVQASRGVESINATVEQNGHTYPAWQMSSPTKEQRGTGLGLWVALGIVTRHGGNIQLASSTRPDRHGTCVSIWLPMHASELKDNRRRRFETVSK